MKIADLWTPYLREHLIPARANIATAEFAWKNLEAHFGSKSAIDQKSIDAYERLRTAGKIGRPSVSSTVRRELAVLLAMLRHAGVTLPALRLPENRPARQRWHDHDEVEKLLEAATGRGKLFLTLALETGARQGAILDLTWDRVDFKVNVVDFRVPGQRVTKKRRTVVPMSARLRAALLEAWGSRGPELTVLGSKGSMWPTVQAIAKRAGVAHTYPHAMRHTVGSLMMRADVPLWKTAKVLGLTVATTEKTYAKFAVDDLRAGVDAIHKRA